METIINFFLKNMHFPSFLDCANDYYYVTIPILFLISWWITLLIHELSHVIAVKLFVKGKVESFTCWPHHYNGNFYFGRVHYTYKNDEKTRAKLIWVHSSPLLINSFTIIIWFLSLLFFSNIFYYLLFCSIFDVVNWLYSYYFGVDHSDGKKFRKYFEERNIT